MQRKMKSKQIGMFLIMGILIISMFGIAMAYTVVNVPVDEPYQEDSSTWLSRFISEIRFNIFKSGLFTVYGDELGCDKTPSVLSTNLEIPWENKFPFKNKLITADSEKAMFINWFYGSPYNGVYNEHPDSSREYQGEIFLADGEEVTLVCNAEGWWDNECYYEIYNCPMPCYSNSDCSSGENCEKTILSQKIPNAGVCKLENPTHQTSVYECDDGTTFLGKVSYGNSNFCTNPNDAKYLIGTTDQCLSYTPSECTTGDECTEDECHGEELWECNNGFLNNVGEKNECKNDDDDGDGGTYQESDSLTWTEYYSMNDKKLVGGIIKGSPYFCITNDNCALKEEYDVSCVHGEDIEDRIWQGYQDQCNDFGSSGGGLLGGLVGGTLKILVNPCGNYATWRTSVSNFFNIVFYGDKAGICIAESQGTFGKIWDKVLRTVGGFGLPAQYVFVISIIMVIALLYLMLMLIKK